MLYQVVFDPNLQASAAQFAADWNGDARAAPVAEARLRTELNESYDPFSAGVALVLVPLAVGLATNALYDLILDVLNKQAGPAAPAAAPPVRRRTVIESRKHPDGTKIVIITSEEM